MTQPPDWVAGVVLALKATCPFRLITGSLSRL
jgi:hypothetical protein